MSVRRPWLIFGLLLSCGIIAFAVTADWSAQSWLDIADYVVGLIAVSGVLIYALGRVIPAASFWRVFRWIFLVVATAQVLVHAIDVAKKREYSASGTVVFVAFIVVIIGWIFVLQWIAMTRLANER